MSHCTLESRYVRAQDVAQAPYGALPTPLPFPTSPSALSSSTASVFTSASGPVPGAATMPPSSSLACTPWMLLPVGGGHAGGLERADHGDRLLPGSLPGPFGSLADARHLLSQESGVRSPAPPPPPLPPGWHTDRLFTLCYLPLCMVMLALGLRYPDCPSPPVRIRIGYAGFTVAMAAVPLLDALLVAPAAAPTPTVDGIAGGAAGTAGGGAAPASALLGVLLCVAVVGACDGLCQGALFGEAAQLPPVCTHALVSGTASSGLLVCLLRIASKASFEAAAAAAVAGAGRAGGGEAAAAEAEARRQAGLRDGTRLYFALGGLLSFSCLLLYDFVLPRLRPSPWSRGNVKPAAILPAAAASATYSIPALAAAGAGATGRDAAADDSSTGLTAAGAGDLESQPLLHQTRSLELSRSLGSRSDGSAGGGGGGGGSWHSTDRDSGWSPPAQPQLAADRGVAGITAAEAAVAVMIPAVEHASAAAPVADPLASPKGSESYAALAAGPGRGIGSDRGGNRDRDRDGWVASLLRPQVRRCLALSWRLCGSLLVTYTVTLSIFPGFLAEDVHSAKLGDWYPILLITAFNAADLLGKSLPCLEPLDPQPHDSKETATTATTDATATTTTEQQRDGLPARLQAAPWPPGWPEGQLAWAGVPPQPDSHHLQYHLQVQAGPKPSGGGQPAGRSRASDDASTSSPRGSRGVSRQQARCGLEPAQGEDPETVEGSTDDQHAELHSSEAPLLAGHGRLRHRSPESPAAAWRAGGAGGRHRSRGRWATIRRWWAGEQWSGGRGIGGDAGSGGRGGSARGGGDGRGRWRLAALAAPLRRPGGLLAASLLRGAVALPAFVLADLWGAPAGVVVALTAALGVSNGYLTSQVLTMGPSAVLRSTAPPPSSPRLRSLPPSLSNSPHTSLASTTPGPYGGGAGNGDEAAPHPRFAPLPGLDGTGGEQAAAGGCPRAGDDAGKGDAATTPGVVEHRAAKPATAGSAGNVGSRAVDSGWAAAAAEADGGSAAGAVAGAAEASGGWADAGQGAGVPAGPSGWGHACDDGLRGVVATHGSAKVPGPLSLGGPVTHGSVPSGHSDAEVVETLLVLSLVAGLNLGAYLGWLWLL